MPVLNSEIKHGTEAHEGGADFTAQITPLNTTASTSLRQIFAEQHITPYNSNSLSAIENINDADDAQDKTMLHGYDATTRNPDSELYGDTDTGSLSRHSPQTPAKHSIQ